MDARLVSSVALLVEKMCGDDFQQLTLASDERHLIIRPMWERASFMVTPREGRAEEVPGSSLLAFLTSTLHGSQNITLECALRSTLTVLTYHGGKLKLQTQAQQFLSAEKVVAGTRQSFIKAAQAKKLLTAIGIMGANGEIKGDKRRKYYQVDRFVELLAHMLLSWPQGEELVVLDSGCGKSYLSFALNYYLHEVLGKKCYFLGIDSNEDVIKASKSIQQQLNYRNMEFTVADLADYTPMKNVNMVLSLHACDTATDHAIALGLYLQAQFIIAVPCCQAALTEEIDYGFLQDVALHPVLKQRLADTITDGLRVLALEARGYKVSVVEYVSPLDTPKNIMIRAEKAQHKERELPYRALKQQLRVTPWIDRIQR
ncbi:MAG: SAM-dependent methyltransferase [Peptococcaceae bacterium]|nr:SAM-dependent methyltransferase [Peptococcaceae bacterium]